jgi:predicted nucleotidyltransferase
MHFTGLSDATLATVQAILASCPAVETAIVYGSRAKGNFSTGSDIDLTLVGAALTQEMLSHLVGQFEESNLPYQVDLSILRDIDNPSLREHVERVGKVIYQRTET